jgi:hypothetical protein
VAARLYVGVFQYQESDAFPVLATGQRHKQNLDAIEPDSG